MQPCLAGLVLVAGCSLIYNTGKIPAQQPDAMADTPPDPSMLRLIDVSPQDIDEGQGDGGSRPVVLVIHGENLVNAQVAVSGAANVQVDNSQVTISRDSSYLAVPVTVHVDGAKEGTTIGLTVQVTQPGAMPQTMSGPKLHAHDELTSGTPTPGQLYSMIDLSSDLSLTASGATTPFTVRVVSSLKLATITAKGGDASGTTGGAAGAGANAGGPEATKGGGSGGGDLGTSGNAALLGDAAGDGGGAGFATAGGAGGSKTGGEAGGAGGVANGDDAISTYAMNMPSGGGGGGKNTGLVAGQSGDGGGGGGGGSVVELTAGGNLTCGAIDVSGGAGAPGASGIGGGGGGGGAGGVIVLRAGGALSTTMLTASGGMGGAGTPTGQGNGGTGSVGRIRWDNAAAATVTASPSAVRGPSFVSPPLITSSPMLSLVGAPGKSLTMYVNGQNATGFALDGSGNASVMAPLVVGFDHVCVVLTGGDASHSESQECIDLAYLP